MARMMVGDAEPRPLAVRQPDVASDVRLELEDIHVRGAAGLAAVDGVSLSVKGGEILGLAGVSGNGQDELIEALLGQRPVASGRLLINGEPFTPDREGFARFKVSGLPGEPLRNAVVGCMPVAENLAFRTFDKPPLARLGWWLSRAAILEHAGRLIERYQIKTPSPATPIANLSGGNIQRAVLARELSGEVRVLIACNPCSGLDFASAAAMRARIIEQRNRGAAVLLASDDLDEILELSDRVAVMSQGRIVHDAPASDASRAAIGLLMAGGR